MGHFCVLIMLAGGSLLHARQQATIVNRRVGGLEVTVIRLRPLVVVNRRVGGLEVDDKLQQVVKVVNRRVGGLEG